VADFDELLAGADLVCLALVAHARLHGGAERLLFHGVEEATHDTELDIRFE
jgi:hypothetical protein